MAIKLAIILMTGLSLAAAALGLHAGMVPDPETARIQWVHYIDLGLPEQDVFVEAGNARAAAPDPYFIAHLLGLPANDGPNVIRVEGQSARTPANLARQVYAATRIVPHDPFKLDPNPLGPYYKGDPLGLTLAEWLAARGSGTYTVSGAEAELRLDLQQLVPDGHYALWCGRMSGPPAYSEADKACGAADGSQNQFKADAQGNAIFHLHLKALPRKHAYICYRTHANL